MDTCTLGFLGFMAFLFVAAIAIAIALTPDDYNTGKRLDDWTMNYGTPDEKIEVLQRQLDEKDKEARQNEKRAIWFWLNR